MNCTSCGANLPQGAAQCQVCGNPTPYNVSRSASSPQYDPNAAAQQPGSGNSPQYDPTVQAQPYGGTPPPPSTAYGAPPYGAPPPPPPNAYNTPSGPPYSYGAPPQQQNYYGTPAPQQPPKRRSRLPMILGIIAIVLIVACAGISFAIYQGLKQTGNSLVTSLNATATSIAATATSDANTTPTTSSNTTPTTSSGNNGPSGLPVDASAAKIITNVQMASAVDSNFKPTKVISTFATKQTIYATFNIDPNAPSSGYVEGKWYADGKYAFSSKILAVQSNFLGYLSAEYNITTQGTVELYWCVQSNCSDAKLADVATFTVSSTASLGTSPSVLAFMDINRP
jgi:hypothetical protein